MNSYGISLRRKSSSKTITSYDTNFTEENLLNSSFINIENEKCKKKSVSFNMNVEIIPVKSFKIKTRDNNYSNVLILLNLKNMKKIKKEEELYVPKEENCIVCSVF